MVSKAREREGYPTPWLLIARNAVAAAAAAAAEGRGGYDKEGYSLPNTLEELSFGGGDDYEAEEGLGFSTDQKS